MKKPINSNNTALTENIETNSKAPKVNDRVRINNYKNIFNKVFTEYYWSKEIFIIDFVLETNYKLGIIKLKIYSEKKL